MQPLSVVVLAAGRGSRMRNPLPKVLHPLAGWPLIRHVLEVSRGLGAARVVTVLAPGADAVAAVVKRLVPDARIAVQDAPMGTGHAVMAARPELLAEGTVLVLFGDTPLLTHETALRLLAAREAGDQAVVVLGIAPPDPTGYGRLRVEAGRLRAIVEERHADEALRREGLCNAGAMAFDAARLGVLLDALELRADKNEYYLTDAVELAVAHGWSCAAVPGPWQDGLGINSQRQLADAERVFQDRRRDALLAAGVIMPAPETVYLAADTEIAAGALVEPYVVFGPGVRIAGEATIHAFSQLEGAIVEARASVGPFARLRPGARLGPDAKVGNFVEVKNAELGPGAKASHLSYLGDATIGAGANIGAGTITCNYDGFGKHRTAIGAGAFIGSNTALVAPISIGEQAVVGAGSTLTENVPAGAVAVARARQTTLPARAARLRERLRSGKGGSGGAT